MAESEKFVEGVAKEKIEKRIAHYEEILSSETLEKTSPEYIQASDVIDEIRNLLEKADEDRSFVNCTDIDRRIEEYFKRLEYLDRDFLEAKKSELEGELGEPSSSVDVPKPRTLDDILAEIDKLAAMEVVPPTPEEVQGWIDSRPKRRVDKQEELSAVEKALSELGEREDSDLAEQIRVTKNRISELQEINGERELFKINEKGEIVVNYPDVEYKIDEAAILAEYQRLQADAIYKINGDKSSGKEYCDAMERIEAAKVEKEFEYIDADGKKQKGKYWTLKEYKGREEDLEFTQLQEMIERMERLSKYDAGDDHAYDDVWVRDNDGDGFRKLDPKEAEEADRFYLNSNNGAYNRKLVTYLNLKTLGKYGEKVDYTKMVQGQPVKNVLRGAGNVLKFVRNHTTAPINKFFGTCLVAPTYALLTGAKENYVSGLYDNKRSHRYVARREYFTQVRNNEDPKHPIRNAIKARWDAVTKSEEGNKAIIDAKLTEIKKSLIKKYTELAKKEANEKKMEFAHKSISEKIEMLEHDLAEATSDLDKAKLRAALEEHKKAQEQIRRDKRLNEVVGITQAVQTDPISYRQHDVANSENVTRTIAGVKAVTRLGFFKLVGPQLKKLIESKLTKTTTTTVPPTQEEIQSALNVSDKKWIPGHTVENEVPGGIETVTELRTDTSVAEMMAGKAGSKVEGYYTVWGGETRPKMYTVGANDRVTAVFEQAGNGGVGFSDTVGLKAPVLTDGTFPAELLEANGLLKQSLTLDQIKDLLGKSALTEDQLSKIFFGINDDHWVRASDFCQAITKEIQLDPTIVTTLVPGHYETLTSAQLQTAIQEALQARLTTDPDFLTSLSHTTIDVAANTKAQAILGNIGKGVATAVIADGIYDNLRHGVSGMPETRTEDPFLDPTTPFTGNRKKDLETARQIREESRRKAKPAPEKGEER